MRLIDEVIWNEFYYFISKLSLHSPFTDQVGIPSHLKKGQKIVPGEKNTLKFHLYWKSALNSHPKETSQLIFGIALPSRQPNKAVNKIRNAHPF